MARQHFLRRSVIAAPAAVVFQWHERPDAFEQLIPPWEDVRLVAQTGPISQEGSRVTLRLRLFGPIQLDWVSEHRNFKPGESFEDTQLSGPFQYWHHVHRVQPETPETCILEDDITYELPLSPLSDWVAGWFVRRKLSRMFEYRHRVTAKDCEVGP